jgi:acetyl esterase/lipase
MVPFSTLCYFALSLILLVTTGKLIYPRLGFHVVASLLSFAGLALSLFLPQIFLTGLLTTLVFWGLGAMEHPLGLVALGIHCLCWLAMAAQGYRQHLAFPLLDGLTLSDPDAVQKSLLPVLGEEARALPAVTWKPMWSMRIPEMKSVKRTPGVIYREVAGRRLRLDVYEPPEKGQNRPAIVYIHGGAWVVGGRRQAKFMCYQLAQQGYVVFALTYRLAPVHRLPAAAEDCKAGIAWVRDHAQEYGVDPSRLYTIGGSAGGHLCALMALTPNDPRLQPGFEDKDTSVQGAVVFYGVVDTLSPFTRKNNPPLALLLELLVMPRSYKQDPALYEMLSPSSHVSGNAPPMLFIHGHDDGLVPVKESRRMAENLRKAGVKSVQVLEVPRGVHAFDLTPNPLYQRMFPVLLSFLKQISA